MDNFPELSVCHVCHCHAMHLAFRQTAWQTKMSILRFGTASSRHFAYASCCLVIWTLPGKTSHMGLLLYNILLAFLSPLKQRTRGRMHQWEKRKLSYTWTYEHRFYMVLHGFTFSKRISRVPQTRMQNDASKHWVWVSNWLPLLCFCDISWKATTWNAAPVRTRRVKLIVTSYCL